MGDTPDFSPGRINFNLSSTPLRIFTRLRPDLDWYLSTWVRKRVNGSVMACWLGVAELIWSRCGEPEAHRKGSVEGADQFGAHV